MHGQNHIKSKLGKLHLMLSVWLVVSGSQQYTNSDKYKKTACFI